MDNGIWRSRTEESVQCRYKSKPRNKKSSEYVKTNLGLIIETMGPALRNAFMDQFQKSLFKVISMREELRFERYQ
jgi:hypothetical protein